MYRRKDAALSNGDEPPLASHLVSPRLLYSHHGIYSGEGRVIHYSGLASRLRSGAVEETSFERFANGNRVSIRKDARRFDAHEVVERARSRIGEQRYNLLTNNCEHFCTWALRDERRGSGRVASRLLVIWLLTLLVMTPLFASDRSTEVPMKHPSYYRTVQVDGVRIFFREAGPRDAPTLLLLHGLPSSSRMFEPLMQRLSHRYHLVAPDYPGFGHSEWPDARKFSYTFDHIAALMNRFTEALGLARYTLYMQDYGGPVGFRMALSHPDRIEALIVQNAVAHDEGLGENWRLRRAFWADRPGNEAALRRNLLSLETTRTRHVGSDPDVERYDPDSWTDEFAFLNQPGQAEIQTELFYDYRNNVASYPRWQAWLRDKQPRLMVLWGRYDLSFNPSEPEAFRRDVPRAEVHVVDGGHFALDTAADEITAHVGNFMGR